MFKTIGLTSPHRDLIVRDAYISDLFFNYEHPAYEGLGDHELEGDAAISAALEKDAGEFADALRGAFGIVLSPAELAADFLARE